MIVVIIIVISSCFNVFIYFPQAIVLVAVLSVALARPAEDDKTQILRYENNNIGVGEYSYTVELSDGTIRHEEAKLVDEGLETEHLRVSGFFEYVGPDNIKYRTDYTADTDGFNPAGDHIAKV